MAIAVQKIYLVPIGQVEPEVLSTLCPPLEERFGYPCEVAPGIELPPGAYHPRRGQYHAPAFLERLLTLALPDAVRVLGITGVDLYVPELNFVFGQAQFPGRVAVISLCRLRPQFYGLEPDQALLQERALKEAVHELGHTFGLSHCPQPGCVMHFSNSLLDTDRKGSDFCPTCRWELDKRRGLGAEM